MRTKTLSIGVCAALYLTASPLYAVDISLFDYAYNIDGVLTPAPGVPAGVNDSLFDYSTGLGTIKVSIGGAGAHYVGLFVDHEIDEAINTYFNEIGSPVNTPVATQTWEIDEPGYFGSPPGDIYANFTAKMLDNTTGGLDLTANDVSMAIGWDLLLGAGDQATVTFLLSDTAPVAGFYLHQYDPRSDASIYFSSLVDIVGGGPGVPDGGATLPMLIAGLSCLAFAARWRKTV